MIERIVSKAAAELKMDPAELRRKNFIPAEAFPYQTPVALQYDWATTRRSLDEALKIADYAGFEARRAEAEAARQAARHRLLHLHRGLRHRAVGRWSARSARGVGLWEVGADPRSTRPATCWSSPARTATARATRRPSPRSSPTSSACRWTRSRSSTATPRRRRSAWAPTARARWPSAARRSSRRPTRSSPRARRSRPTCWKPPRPTSSSRTAPSRSPARTRTCRWRRRCSPPTCRTTIRSTRLEPGLDENAFYDPANFTYPGRHAHLRGRDRPGDRRRRGRSLHPRSTMSATSSTR